MGSDGDYRRGRHVVSALHVHLVFVTKYRRGVLDDEMLMALPPDYLPKAVAGMEALAKNGLRYPFPQYGIQQDVRAGMAVSYPGRG